MYNLDPEKRMKPSLREYKEPKPQDKRIMPTETWDGLQDKDSLRVHSIINRYVVVVEPRQEGVLHPPVKIIQTS